MTSGSSAARLAHRLDARGVHYGSVVAAVSFLMLFTAAGFRSTVGVLIVPLLDEFGRALGVKLALVAATLALGAAARHRVELAAGQVLPAAAGLLVALAPPL